jgi:hypothetical protein
MSKKNTGQTGIISIMVTMIMMIVISLLVLGFAELSRTEQRNALDQQLSVQAYYAAETGVNDARQVIHGLITGGQTVPDKTICGNQGVYTLSSAVDAQHNVTYTCVLINASPTTLVYNVGYNSTVIPLMSGGGAFNKINLSWKLPAGTTNGSASGCYSDIASLGQLPVASEWNCDYPIVRVDLLNGNGGLARANWNANTTTVFLVPFNSSSVDNNASATDRGRMVAAQCDVTSCAAHITGLTGAKYYMRVTTLYRANSQLSINADGTTFTGAEATIDSTGKAQDVLRRILVAVDLTDANAYKIPSAGLVVRDSVCKRFGVTNGYFAVYDAMNGGSNIPLCQLQSAGSPAP